MEEFGLQRITSPVFCFMKLSGQFLPPLVVTRILVWVITTGSLVLLTLLSTVELIVKSSKFNTVVEIITILLTLMEMCFRVIYFSANRGKLQDIIEKYNSFPVSCSTFVKSEEVMKSRAMQRSRLVLLQFSGYVFMILLIYLCVPFLPEGPDLSALGFAPSDITQSIINPDRKRPLYLPMWTYNNIETLPLSQYHILVIWQGFTFCVLVCVFCAIDCLLYTFIIFLVEAMQHLERISAGSSPLSSNLKTVKDLRHLNLQADLEYRVWVKQHQFVLNLCQEVSQFFSPIILLTFLVNGVVLCVLAYVIVKLRNVIGIICVLGHFSCIVIKLYVMALFGQNLKDQSTKVMREGKIWPRLGRTRRTDARIVMLRSNTPVTLKGFGYFDLTIEVFGRVCSVALSFFIVLLQLH